MKRIYSWLFLSLTVVAFACKKGEELNADNGNNTTKVAPDGFTYNTSKTINLNIRLLTNDNQPIKGVIVSLYPGTTNTDVSNIMFKGMTDATGTLRATLAVPSYIDTFTVDPEYVGLMRYAKTYLTSNQLNVTIGGAGGFSGNVAGRGIDMPNKWYIGENRVENSVVYKYMGTYNNLGRPSYLTTPGDIISAGLLSRINQSLPERTDVRQAHPEYLSSTATPDIVITQLADVWLTFVHEGAGYLNSLGYFVYNTNNPPTNPAQIDTIYHVLPNASLNGSGGDMRSGDKVYLGRYDAGKSIGFVIFANGWSSSSRTVNTNADKFYSNTNFNPEPTAALRRHHVLLYDQTEQMFLVGFEDINRSFSGCDHDFNDLVFYCKSNPVTAISTDNVANMDIPTDSDGDGVANTVDEFPNDPARAYRYYYPSQNNWATIAFEDLWPASGDYDMNDLLIDYRYTFICNAANNVVDMNASYAIGAAGASFNNGFGLQLDVAPSAISSITGRRITGNYLSFNANGTEAGQSKAVIIPFDNHRSLISDPSGSIFINTQMDRPRVSGDTVNLSIAFAQPMPVAGLLSTPMNHFIISNQRRGYEVHLPGYLPTDKADASLFGQWSDNTSPQNNRYYLAKDNSPWAINFLQKFIHPTETSNIKDAYLRYTNWVNSSGTTNTDWYSNTGAGYRNNALIYTR
ncbi:MAG: LruC domain-containing protein [Chitinophagaceae bacterium]